MTERWLMAKIYYSLANLENEEDPSGNTILVDFVRPTIAFLRQQGWISWSTFMRFSEEGYHIRFMVYGDETVLAENVGPYIRQTLVRHRAAHPEVSQQPMQLAPLAVRLNQKWGGPKEKIHLRAPNDDVIGLMYDTGENQIYESKAAFTAHYNLHTDACDRALELLVLEPKYTGRKTLVRLLVEDYLRLSGLSNQECYYFLTYLRFSWIDYFELSEADLMPAYTLYAQRASRYRAYFARKRGPQDSLAMLPERLRPFYCEWLDALQEKVPPTVGRDENGDLTSYGSLRLLGFFHLMHNRLGIGMLQELYMAYVLAQHYREHLTAEETAAADEWARQMHALSMSNPTIA